MTVLAIDPGLDTGWAVLRDGKLVNAGIGAPPHAAILECTHVLIERPQVYRPGASKGNPNDLITIKTNEGKFNPDTVAGIGSVEILSDESMDLLRAAKTDNVAEFAATHPTLISAH